MNKIKLMLSRWKIQLRETKDFSKSMMPGNLKKMIVISTNLLVLMSILAQQIKVIIGLISTRTAELKMNHNKINGWSLMILK